MRKEHNTRGKQSNNEFGYGYITEKGYHRVWDTTQKRYRLEHNIIWEQHYGEIPNGKQVHHIDGNKLNNNIANLKLVSTLEHKRLHSGCIEKDGVLYKPCRKCKVYKPIDQYYKREIGISAWCKQCCVENAVMNKRRRKNENKQKTIQ